MKTLVLILCLIHATSSTTVRFANPLQRFVYDERTETIVLASVNHLYSLNASDLSILTDIDLSPSKLDHQCLLSNKTTSSKYHYYFPTSSYLYPSANQTFNQLLLLNNGSVLTCSTSNRGGSCQLRSLSHLHIVRNSSQRLVSSSPFYPSIGLINSDDQVLYLANTYDSQCDPFYEIPTLSGRSLRENDFLSTIHFNAGQSALQQSTSTLRLLNVRLVKDFFLHYLYAFEHQSFAYFLTVQQSDLHHRHRLQTKILRFCHTLNQTIIKSYIEIPLTCGTNYHYLVTAKFSKKKKILYGLFRNTPLANLTGTSHAICAYSIDSIQEAFFQTIKRCLVDGKGHRGLGFISPDTHCVTSKDLNEIGHDYCPSENESFFQYPIGGHRPLEQSKAIIEFNDRVNFTSMEVGSHDQESMMLFVGDDNGTVHTFHTSNTAEIYRQHFQSKTIVDLQLIHQRSTLADTKLLIMTDNQIIKQNLTSCEQYSTCGECSKIPLCHWCSADNRCASLFECVQEKRKDNRLEVCTSIERVIPDRIFADVPNIALQVVVNAPLRNDIDQYMCRFDVNDGGQSYYTNIILIDRTIRCLPPVLTNTTEAVYYVILSMYHKNTNLTFGYYKLTQVNCSNFLSCSSCASYSNWCQWDRQTVKCVSQPTEKPVLSNHSHLIRSVHQCPHMYLAQSVHRLPYSVDRTLVVHLEQCNRTIDIQSCQLYDRRQRFLLTESNPVVVRSVKESSLCLLKCAFQWANYQTTLRLSFHRPLKLELAVAFSDDIATVIPHTQISLYRCERMALNCTSCLHLDPSYGCIWCNNQCMLKNESIRCLDKQECLLPIIRTVEPLMLPLNGGTLVTIQGKHFDLFDLSVHIAGISCQVIEEESSREKIVCKSGDAQSPSRTGPVHLKFGSYGPQISSRQIVSYLNPTIGSIKPLLGIQSGGTMVTVQGTNFTMGNSRITVWIGNQSCHLLSISQMKIECATRSFPRSMVHTSQPIKLAFDQQTELVHEHMFTVVPNPILYSFDTHHPYRSFKRGGHQLVIVGDNFNLTQNIQLEFKHQLFVSPLSHNNTHLIFLTPSTQELSLHNQKTVELTLYLDNFNRTSSLVYLNDPLIYELEPLVQPYTEQLTILGRNLTAVGHTKADIMVSIGCQPCPVIHLQADKLTCQPPASRPQKYSSTRHLCFSSEHPSITVSIDNIQTQVGYMVYPKRLIVLGVISGCLITILVIVAITLLIVCLKIRYAHQKYLQRYFYSDSINSQEMEKEKPYPPISTPPSTLPLRSYLNYLQHSYYSNHPSSDLLKHSTKQELIDQFQFLVENNEEFVDSLIRLAIQSSNKTILNDLILTQRYNFKKLFSLNDETIFFSTCILTSYEALISHPIHSLLSQLYHQLKNKIHSGPIDAIEQTTSYYSLNMNAILHDSSMAFKTIQLIVHIDLNNSSSNDLSINLTCLTCDTISQVKEKILCQIHSWTDISLDDCKLYLLTSHSCSSSSSSASTASSSVPLLRKSMLTQVLFNRTIKYSTTTINDPYRESSTLLLNDMDHTNEHVQNWRKLNTLQHYGILTDGYELKMVLANRGTNSPRYSVDLKSSLRSSCHYCSVPTSDVQLTFHHLPPSPFHDTTRAGYIHLVNHTYEEIGSDFNHLLMDENHHQTYRLFETKSVVHSVLIQLIETLFTDLRHTDTYLNELIEQYAPFFHIFYAHFLPFLLRNLHCLFDVPIDKCLNSSMEILAMVFQRACCAQNDSQCSLCTELSKSKNFNFNVQNATLLFADEIQRIRLCYSNLERTLHDKNASSEYSSTNTGIDQKFQLDNSIFDHLFEYTAAHSDEIAKCLKSQSTDKQTLPLFLNLMQMYRLNRRASSVMH